MFSPLAHAQETDAYLRLLTLNGGQTLRVGDSAILIWEKSANVSDCFLGYSVKPPGNYPEGGSFNLIDRAYTGTGSGPEPRIGSYPWTVGVGTMDDSGQKKIKIVLSCLVTGQQQWINAQSKDYLTVTDDQFPMSTVDINYP